MWKWQYYPRFSVGEAISPCPPIPRSDLCKWIALPQAKKNVTQHNCYFNHCLLYRYTSYFTSHNLLNICLLNQSNILKTVYWAIIDSLHFHEHFRVSQISHWYHCEAEDLVYPAVWLVWQAFSIAAETQDGLWLKFQ